MEKDILQDIIAQKREEVARQQEALARPADPADGKPA